MPRVRLQLGDGARVSVLLKYLHPAQYIQSKYINFQNNLRLENCLVIRQEAKTVSRRQQNCVVLHHEHFKDGETFVEVHAVQRWVQVQSEGPRDRFFNNPQVLDSNEAVPQEVQEQVRLPDEAVEMAERSFVDPLSLNQLGPSLMIDDDNEPAPENVPNNNSNANIQFFEWGINGNICNRMQTGATKVRARILNFLQEVRPTTLQLFELLFPKSFVIDVMLKKMNEQVTQQITYGEFLRFIGLWFLMATTHFDRRNDFWSTQPPDPFHGVLLRFNDWMSRARFEEIVSALQYTDEQPPAYLDKFWEVCQMLDAFNNNMQAQFRPSWISCIDESMSKWVSQYSCPGFMLVPQKPWPCGNKYHTISCGETEILYRLDLVEGKDEPRERPPKKYSEYGKTVGCMLRLAEPLFSSSFVVVMDSGFCILQGLIELLKRGVFASALIKKRRYWPKFIDGDKIIEHFESREVGDIDSWPGVLDNEKFSIMALKEPDYVMIVMTTYGSLRRMGKENKRVYLVNGDRRAKTFQYPEVIANHFTYRDSVDANNRDRMFPIALEETWKTTRWATRVFQFILALTEVNVRRAQVRIYGEPTASQQSFRRELARQLIFNPYLTPEPLNGVNLRPRLTRHGHALISIPCFKKFDKTG